MAASSTAPVETKVAAGTGASLITGVITWIMVMYVPVFHAGLPAALAAFLPWIVALVSSALAGYLAPHTPRSTLMIRPGAPQRQP